MTTNELQSSIDRLPMFDRPPKHTMAAQYHLSGRKKQRCRGCLEPIEVSDPRVVVAQIIPQRRIDGAMSRWHNRHYHNHCWLAVCDDYFRD